MQNVILITMWKHRNISSTYLLHRNGLAFCRNFFSNIFDIYPRKKFLIILMEKKNR